MAEKKAKITECTYGREYTGQNGVVHYHNIKLDNGDYGNIGAKEKMPAKLAVGQELSYTIEAAGEYQGTPQFKIKAVQQQGGGRGFGGKSPEERSEIMRMSVLKTAVEFASFAKPTATSSEVVEIAKFFEKYVTTKTA